MPFELELINSRQCLIENQKRRDHGMRGWLAATREKLHQPPVSIMLLAWISCWCIVNLVFSFLEIISSRALLLRGFGKSRRDV